MLSPGNIVLLSVTDGSKPGGDLEARIFAIAVV